MCAMFAQQRPSLGGLDRESGCVSACARERVCVCACVYVCEKKRMGSVRGNREEAHMAKFANTQWQGSGDKVKVKVKR